MQLIGETKKCATGAKGWGRGEGAKFAKAKRVGSELKKNQLSLQLGDGLKPKKRYI